MGQRDTSAISTASAVDPKERPMAKAMKASAEGMNLTIPEIRWHHGPTGLNEAILSLDFVPQDVTSSGKRILATGGADKEIKLWRIQENDTSEKSAVQVEFVFSLSGHDRSVNCVRFSPDGTSLASSSDDSTVFLWTKPKHATEEWSWDTITSFSDVSRTLFACGHKGDITDLAWSPDGAFLCSTSVDNTSVIWNVATAQPEERRRDHTQYVQGVAWDPLNEFLVTQGNDRTCRVYTLAGFDATLRQSGKKGTRKFTCTHTIRSRTVHAPTKPNEGDASSPAKHVAGKQEAGAGAAAMLSTEKSPGDVAFKHRMYVDDTFPGFARRPTWTPDGRYLLTPTGLIRSSDKAQAVNTVYAFARGNLAEPAVYLPGQEKASVAVRCCPLLFQGKGDGEANRFDVPEHSVFAVITLNAIYIYDTQHAHPICTMKDLHYADLTDVSWSADGQLLTVSSMDGYLTFVHFKEGFFGEQVPRSEYRERLQKQRMEMMASIKPVRKKKAKAVDADAAGDAAKNAKTHSLGKKAKGNVLASPLLAAFPKPNQTMTERTTSTTSSSSSEVHVLQVRKKRKIAPTLVDLTPSSSSTTMEEKQGPDQQSAARASESKDSVS